MHIRLGTRGSKLALVQTNWVKEKLEQQGITSVREALYQRNNVYLICTFDKGLEYLTSLYENTTCAEVDRAGLFHIYKLQSL